MKGRIARCPAWSRFAAPSLALVVLILVGLSLVESGSARAEGPTQPPFSPAASAEAEPRQQTRESSGAMPSGSTGIAPQATTTLINSTWDDGTAQGWLFFDNDGATNGEYFWRVNACRFASSPFSIWAVGGGAQGALLDCLRQDNYPNNASSWAIVGPVSLANATDATLSFHYYVNTEAVSTIGGVEFGDSLRVLATADCQSFQNSALLTTLSGEIGAGTFTGLLPSGLLGQPSVCLAFGFVSDSSVTLPEGAYVDTVLLQATVSGGGATPTATRTGSPTPTQAGAATPSPSPSATATPRSSQTASPSPTRPSGATATQPAGATATRTGTPTSGGRVILNESWDAGPSLPSGWRTFDNDRTIGGDYAWGVRANCWYTSTANAVWASGGGADGAARDCLTGYPNSSDSWLVSGPFSLANASAARLKVSYWLDSEQGYDTLTFGMSTDGTNFPPLVDPFSGPLYDRVFETTVPNSFLGQASVYLGIRFLSDASNTGYGAYIDDISLTTEERATATAIATPTPTPTALGTSTPGPSATPTPTQTPTATLTATSSPTVSPSPTPAATKGSAPVVTGIGPTSGSDRALTGVKITGSNFRAGARVLLASATGQEHPLTSISVSDSATIRADVPTGIPAGTYDVVVTNADGTVGRLTRGFTVTSESPRPETILPAQGSNTIPNDVTIDGFNFAENVTVELVQGTTAVALSAVTREGSTRVRAVVPPGLAPGIYDVVVRNPSVTAPGTLAAAYSVTSPNSEDFFVNDTDLWTAPTSVRQNDTNVRLGVNLHRQGGQATVAVTVKFFLVDPQNPSATGIPLGQATSPPIPPNGEDSAFIQWSVGNRQGAVTLKAVVEPPATITESTTQNNTAMRSLTILPPAPDQTPPDLTNIILNGGAIQTAASQVNLDLAAQDNAGGSGLATMYLVEREFSSSAKQWIPIQQTGFISYSSPYSFTLTGSAGVRFIQAYVADAAGNISLNLQKQRIDFVPPSDTLRQNQVRIYRRNLKAGDAISLRLEPASGDADLWLYNATGNSVLVRNNSGPAPDEGAFTAPADGVYQIEIFAYSDTTYRLTIVGGQPAQLAAAAQTLPALTGNPDKPDRPTAFIPVTNEPEAKLGVAAAPVTGATTPTATTPTATTPTATATASPSTSAGPAGFRVFVPLITRANAGW